MHIDDLSPTTDCACVIKLGARIATRIEKYNVQFDQITPLSGFQA